MARPRFCEEGIRVSTVASTGAMCTGAFQPVTCAPTSSMLRGRQKLVPRFASAAQAPGRLRAGYLLGGLVQYSEGLFHRGGPATLELLAQGLALEVLHDRVGATVRQRAEIVIARDVLAADL